MQESIKIPVNCGPDTRIGKAHTDLAQYIRETNKSGVTVFCLRFSTRLLCSLHEQSRPIGSTNLSVNLAYKSHLAVIALAV